MRLTWCVGLGLCVVMAGCGTSTTLDDAGVNDGGGSDGGTVDAIVLDGGHDAGHDAAAPSCTNGVQDGTETDTDCGGGTCAACDNGATCSAASDCTSGVCDATAHMCVAATCLDTVQNGSETDTDCGGPDCAPCADGDTCAAASDCTSGVCDATALTCSAATCSDSVQNGDETDTDCGGGTCSPCDAGGACATHDDCSTHDCDATSSTCVYARDCYELLTLTPTLPDGRYMADVDGSGALDPMTVQCDMTTEGGGWTLVLEYAQLHGTSPALDVRTTTLPLSGPALGVDGSLTPESWGHAGNALMSALTFDETMWIGASSGHGRVIQFVTNAPTVNAYLRTGTGSMADVYDPQYTRVLDGRVDSTLPLHMAQNDRQVAVDQGDLAMTEHPFYGGSAIQQPRAAWSLTPATGDWNADDIDTASANDTLHEVWVRPSPCTDGVQNLGESGVDCGGACGGCAEGGSCGSDGDCLTGSCTSGTCDVTIASSCAALLAAHAGIPSGAYLIDVDDAAGPIAPFTAYCDMTFDGGGWTMVLSTAYGSDPGHSTEGEVLTGTTSNLPPATLTALASASHQVHMRTFDTEELRSITSIVDAPAITRLAALGMIEAGASGPGALTDYTGPFADLAHMQFTCTTFSGTWPSVYQSCGTNGVHLWTDQGGHSRWNWLGGNRGLNEPMEVYVR